MSPLASPWFHITRSAGLQACSRGGSEGPHYTRRGPEGPHYICKRGLVRRLGVLHLFGELALEVREGGNRNCGTKAQGFREPPGAKDDCEKKQEAGELEQAFHAAIVAPQH